MKNKFFDISTKRNLIIGFVFCLICNSIIIIALFINLKLLKSKNLNLKRELIEIENYAFNRDTEFFLINYFEILKFINSSTNNRGFSNSGIFIIIPPFPCDVCLNNDIGVLLNYQFSNQSNLKINLIVPQYRVRELYSKLQRIKNLKIYTYNLEEYTINSNRESILYLLFEKNHIIHFFISTKYNVKMSEQFLKMNF